MPERRPGGPGDLIQLGGSSPSLLHFSLALPAFLALLVALWRTLKQALTQGCLINPYQDHLGDLIKPYKKVPEGADKAFLVVLKAFSRPSRPPYFEACLKGSTYAEMRVSNLLFRISPDERTYLSTTALSSRDWEEPEGRLGGPRGP